MTGTAGVLALVVANIALIVGWLVSGTQRVAEDLVKDRREKYLALVSALDQARAGEQPAAALQPLVTAAEFVASRQMLEFHLIDDLVAQRGADEAAWNRARAAFLVAARHESQNNQAIRRQLRRKAIYGSAR